MGLKKNLLLVLIGVLFLATPSYSFAQSSENATAADSVSMDQKIDAFFGNYLVAPLNVVLFFDPFDKLGIYDPVVYNEGVPVVDSDLGFSVSGEAGSSDLQISPNGKAGVSAGDRVVISDQVYTVAAVSDGSVKVKEPLASALSTAPVSSPVQKPIPFVVVWLVLGAIFFTIRMRFINFRGFRHALDLVQGKYDNPNDKGEVSHFQALATALSATVGLGNIAGVAIAVSIGGAGATFWMITAGLIGMASKFTECTLGVKYRIIDSNGHVSGGPMYYLSRGLAAQNKAGLGKILAILFAILCIGGSFGGGNMFQVNQAFSQMSAEFPALQGNGVYFGMVMAVLVGIVIIGGIRSIAKVTDKIVPFMVGLYVLFSLIIIGINITEIGGAFAAILSGAFSASALKGGVIGVLIVGFQRAAFSNEAGVGSASIAHSASKTNEPVSEGIVALLEPFIDTVVVCTMTALVLIFTGYATNTEGLEGANLTSAAFQSVFPWFKYVLMVAILLFAFSTMISWSYYGQKAFTYLFGRTKTTRLVYKLIFLFFIIVGAASQMNAVTDFSDMMILGMAFPNILGLIFLSKEVRADMISYFNRIRTGEITRYK
ncbi:alanine:cation symporter family protein [bacterium SCSIO 12741]|nr:alanine:cation symporter family protein [bacterium SCSIO 12741]